MPGKGSGPPSVTRSRGVVVWVSMGRGDCDTEAEPTERCRCSAGLARTLGRGAKPAIGPRGLAQRGIQAGKRAQGSEQDPQQLPMLYFELQQERLERRQGYTDPLPRGFLRRRDDVLAACPEPQGMGQDVCDVDDGALPLRLTREAGAVMAPDRFAQLRGEPPGRQQGLTHLGVVEPPDARLGLVEGEVAVPGQGQGLQELGAEALELDQFPDVMKEAGDEHRLLGLVPCGPSQETCGNGGAHGVLPQPDRRELRRLLCLEEIHHGGGEE